jgi:hypothetical protein
MVAKADLRYLMREQNQTINSFFPTSLSQRKKHVFIGLTRETNHLLNLPASAGRLYLALRGAVVRRWRGDQDCHVAL